GVSARLSQDAPTRRTRASPKNTWGLGVPGGAVCGATMVRRTLWICRRLRAPCVIVSVRKGMRYSRHPAAPSGRPWASTAGTIAPPQPGEALAVVHGVAAWRVAERFRRPRQRVFEQRAEVEHQCGTVRLRRAVLVLPHPQLDVLDARQVDPGGREHLRDRAPARA